MEQQKKILEELKQHKESHEELKRIQLVKNQETKNDIQVSTASPAKQGNMELQPGIKPGIVKNILILENAHKVDKVSQNEILLNKNYITESPKGSENISFGNTPKQKALGIIVQKEEKNRLEDLGAKENTLPKNIIHIEKNNKSIDVKPDTSFLNKNITSNIDSKDKISVSNIPSFNKKLTNQFNIPEDVKNSEMRVKRRETLAKKNDFEGTISLPKNSIEMNQIVHHNDQSGT